MPDAPLLSCAVAFALALPIAGCGAAPPPGASVAAPADADAPAPPPASSPDRAKQRLQGLWEIVRYTSDAPIPDNAMPIMGELFDVLRLRFEDGTMTASAQPGSEEKVPFSIADERGDEFTLVAQGGLFDGARCRLLDDDSWEAKDSGPTWPGVSVLRRGKPVDVGAKAKPRAPPRGIGPRPKR